MRKYYFNLLSQDVKLDCCVTFRKLNETGVVYYFSRTLTEPEMVEKRSLLVTSHTLFTTWWSAITVVQVTTILQVTGYKHKAVQLFIYRDLTIVSYSYRYRYVAIILIILPKHLELPSQANELD